MASHKRKPIIVPKGTNKQTYTIEVNRIIKEQKTNKKKNNINNNILHRIIKQTENRLSATGDIERQKRKWACV